MIADEIDPGLGHKSGQRGDEIQRLEDHLSGAVAIGGFQLIAYLALGDQ